MNRAADLARRPSHVSGTSGAVGRSGLLRAASWIDMRFLYIYFMRKAPPDRLRATARTHATYWRERALRDYLGGPFADRSGGLITFAAESAREAEQLVADDPFLRGGLIARHWVKEWLTE
jgi:YCII-related domain